MKNIFLRLQVEKFILWGFAVLKKMNI